MNKRHEHVVSIRGAVRSETYTDSFVSLLIFVSCVLHLHSHYLSAAAIQDAFGQLVLTVHVKLGSWSVLASWVHCVGNVFVTCKYE